MIFGEFSHDEVKEKLGKPVIDYDRGQIFNRWEKNIAPFAEFFREWKTAESQIIL